MKYLLLLMLALVTVRADNPLRLPRLGTNEAALYRETAPVINIKAAPYNATGDGATDDWAAIQAAIDVAEVNGGTVYFPTPGVYRITQPLVVSSRYPVNLKGDMSGYGRDWNTPKSTIALGASIGTNYMITYRSPTANRGESGAGVISGLIVTDLSFVQASSPGVNETAGAFNLYDFLLGTMDGVQIDHIKGSAIRTDFVIKSNFRDIKIHFTGDTGQPALWVTLTDSVNRTQGCDFTGFKMEVNHAAPYLQEDLGATENKYTDFVFEADTLVAGSLTNFMLLSSSYNTYSGMSFARNEAVLVRMEGSGLTMDNAVFRGSPNGTESLIVSGQQNSINGLWNTGKTNVEVRVTGSYNIFENPRSSTSGKWVFSGIGNSIRGGTFLISAGNPSFTGDWITLTTDCSVDGIVMVGLSNLVNGVSLSGTGPKLTRSTLKGLNYGYIVGSDNSLVSDNIIYGNTFDYTNLTVSPLIGNGNNLMVGGQYLQASATYDPPSLGPGDSRTVLMTVTNAALNDFSYASFSNPNAVGVQWTADVIAGDTVNVTAWNTTDGTIDFASGTLKVWVQKSFTTSANNNGTVSATANTSFINTKVTKTSGTAVLVGGTVVVGTADVTANSRIFLTGAVPGGTPGAVNVSARTPGASFTITSTSGTDTSTVAWMLFEP